MMYAAEDRSTTRRRSKASRVMPPAAAPSPVLPTPFTIVISDIPFGDNTPQEDIERRRAERMAREMAKGKAKDKAKTSRSKAKGKAKDKAKTSRSRFLLECAEPPACVKGTDDEERRWLIIPFETKFTDDATELRSYPVKFRHTDESP